VTVVQNRRFQTVELENSRSEYLKPSPSDLGACLRVTVIFTTQEGTVAALRAAQDLARDLQLQIVLVIPEVVSFHFPLDRPSVSVDVLEQRSLAFISDSGVDAEEVSIELYFCRDRKQCLQRILVPNSVVVIGGRKRWRLRQERKLEEFVRSLGHRVISIDVSPKSEHSARFFLH
jgi:hypothetical protein